MSICSLDGRRALVTGAVGGLGAAISAALANSGADVALADLDLDKARKLSSALTEKFPIRTFTSMEVDVTSEASVAKAFEHAVNKLGGLDTLLPLRVSLNHRVLNTFLSLAGGTCSLATWTEPFCALVRCFLACCGRVLDELFVFRP